MSFQSSGKKHLRRIWSEFEEDALLTILEDIVVKCGIRCGDRCFQLGTLKEIEVALTKVIPTCGLKVTPHIEKKTKKKKKKLWNSI